MPRAVSILNIWGLTGLLILCVFSAFPDTADTGDTLEARLAAQRTKFFGMMRCIGMSKKQIKRFVRLEALNWCKTAVYFQHFPIPLIQATL